jgi:hypothetical protein
LDGEDGRISSVNGEGMGLVPVILKDIVICIFVSWVMMIEI